MKILFRNLLLIFSLLVIIHSCHDRRPSVKANSAEIGLPEKKGPGRIVFDKEIHNFGTLKDGEVVSFTFRFRNKGGAPFHIVKGEKSCGCIEIRYSSKPITPGDSSTVELILNTSGEWGNVIREATIETSDGERKELHIGAYIENKQFNNL